MHAPSLKHKFGRLIGTRLHGVKGVDGFLRALHHPDHRTQDWFETIEQLFPDGPKCHLASRWFTEWTVYFYGNQDPQLTAWIRQHAKPEWVALDIGANFGFYACVLAALVRDVHAFEPVPWLAERLERNRSLNAFSNLRINRAALGDHAGQATLNLPQDGDSNWGQSSLLQRHREGSKAIEVELDTLDAYCNRHHLRPDFIKIDVEGAEHLVLRGASKVLKESRPQMVIELNLESHTEVLDHLRNAHYAVLHLDGRPATNFPHFPYDILVVPR